jgi:serine/threonine protein phosphatase PrpC
MIRYIDVFQASERGRRDFNEDVERIVLNMRYGVGEHINTGKAPVDVFIVCDGHGGSMVAEYASEELEKHLTHPRLRYPLSAEYVKKVYNSIQNKVKQHPKRIAKHAGCTALVLIRYMYQNNVWIQVINLGDCRAVMSKSGIAVPLTRDHKPHWPDEKRRIDKVNETNPGVHERVHFAENDWRIKELSVSRSFGDLDNAPYISHIPDVFTYPLTNQDKFIILACDGVWDVLENHEVINFVSDHLTNNHIELYDLPNGYNHRQHPREMTIADKLARYAIARGSGDNVSVIIIDLYAILSRRNDGPFGL